MRIINYTGAEFCVSLWGLSWCMVCRKHDPACLCRCHSRFWLGMCATQSRDGRRRCQLLDPVGIEPDTGSTMEKQSRNAGVESEQTLKTITIIQTCCKHLLTLHFGSLWHVRAPAWSYTPFTRTCASRMAHRLRQTSTIFRQVEILLAQSKWTSSEAGSSNISIYYAFNVRLLTKSWQPICLFEQSELSSSAWHTKFHGISNIQTWMRSTLHSYGFYGKFCFMSINPFIHFPMAHRWSDQLSFLSHLLMLLVSSAQLPALSQSLGSLPENRALPRSSSTSNNSSSRPSSRPLQSLSKTSPGWVLTGSKFNKVRWRSEIKF